ncbi:hypothetical protein JCM6882_003568 [Rhodosporidiobolus microsporus]
MFWRSIPRAVDVLARPDDPPAGYTQRSIAKPSPPQPPQRPPAPSAPPTQPDSDEDGDDDEGTRSPPPRRSRSRLRRLSLGSGGGSAMKRAVSRVMADEAERKKRDASPQRQTMHDVVVAAVRQEEEEKSRTRGKGGLASRVVKRRRSVGEFLKLNKKKDQGHDLDAELVEASRVTPFDASAPPSPSAISDSSSGDGSSDEDRGRSRFEANKSDLRDLERRLDRVQLGQAASDFPPPSPSPSPSRSRSPSPRPTRAVRSPSPIPSYDEADELPPYGSPPPRLVRSPRQATFSTPAPYLPPPPRPPSRAPSLNPSRRATTAYEPYQPRQPERPPSRPAQQRRDTSPALSAQLNPYELALRKSMFVPAADDSDEDSDSDSDRSSTLSPSSGEEDYDSDVASSLAPAPPSAVSLSSNARRSSLPRLPRSHTLPLPALPPRPPLPASYTDRLPPPVPPLPSSPSTSKHEKAPAGLTNLGNTCYLNCVLQCLVATEPLAQFFLSGEYEKEINTRNKFGMKGQLARAFAHIARQLTSGERDFVSPTRLRDTIVRAAEQFDNREQHDAHDFLLYLLDALHEDLNLVLDPPPVKPTSPAREAELEQLPEVVAADQEWAKYRERNDSMVIDFFQGQVRNRMECMFCQQTSTTFSPLQSLSLSIPLPPRHQSNVSLQSCIDDFLREEILSGDNAWNCPNCRRPREASKRFSVARLPQFLVIHLKRFVAFDSFASKVETPVTFPLDGLELGNLLPPMAFAPLFRLNSPHEQETTYELYGVCAHLGTDGGGHYKATIRRGLSWFEADDETVKPVSEDDVRATASTAYLLFYQIARR